MGDATPPKQSSILQRLIPGLVLFRGYRREWLAGDLLAGLSGCVVMIPSVIAYAGLMGLPPQIGLYAALVPLLAYPLFGSSPQMIVGPDIAISLLTVSAVAPLAQGNAAHAVTLSAALALISGVLLLLGARAKLGAVANFLSKPVLVGYMTGAALILIGSQLDKLFRIKLERSDFFPRLLELAGKLQQTHEPTLLLGLALLALILVLRRFAPKIPLALAVVVIALGASYAFKLPQRGVAVVGTFPSGLPAFSFPTPVWRELQALLPAAIGIALLTYTEGILLARAFAEKNGYAVDANQELAALGFTNVFTALFQGFSVTGSQSRTLVNDSAGGKSQAASLVAAVAFGLFLLWLTPLIACLPTVSLAAILIYGGFTLVEFGVMKRIYAFYPRSAGVAAVTTLGVLAAGVVPGILLGVALSLLGLISRLSHPADAVLTEIPGHGFHDLGGPSSAQTLPGLIVYRFYAPLLFPNTGQFVQRVHQLLAASPDPVRWFLIDAQAITDIDVTAAEALHTLHVELQKRGVILKFAHANRPFLQILERTGLAKELNPDSFFGSVHECVETFQNPITAAAQGRDAQR
jgi:sulfate permease, SulP family